MVEDKFVLIVTEKFRKGTSVRVISTGTQQEVSQRRSEIKFAGRRGQPFIIPESEVKAFTAARQTGIFKPTFDPVKAREEEAAAIRRQKEQSRFERLRTTAKEPTREGTIARQILQSEFGIQTKEPTKVVVTPEQLRKIKVAFGGPTKDATPSQIAEARRTGQDFFVGGERITPGEAEVEQARDARAEGTRATVSVGPSLTEATLDLKPSGAVVGFGSRAVLEQAEPEQARDMFAPSFVPARKTEAQETILRPSQEIFFPTEKTRGEVRAEPKLDFAASIRRKGLKLGFQSGVREKGIKKVLPALGAAGLGFVGFFAFAATHPIQFIKGSFETIRHPVKTFEQIVTQAKISPALTAGEIGAVIVTGKLGGKVTRVVAKKVIQPKMAAISTFKPTRKPRVTKTTPFADVQTVSTTKKLHPFGEPLSDKALMSLDKPIVTEKKLEITISNTGKVTQKVIEPTKQPPKQIGEPSAIVSGETAAAGFTRLGETGDIGKTMFPGLAKEITKPKGRGKLGELFGGERQRLFLVEEQVPITQFKLVGLSKLKVIQPSLTKVKTVAGVFAAQKLTRFTGVGAIPKQLTTLKAIQTPVTRLIQRPSTKIAQAQLSITKPISDVKSITELKPLTATIITPVISPVIKSLSRLAVRQEVLSRTQLRTIQQLKPFPRAAPFAFPTPKPRPIKEKRKKRLQPFGRRFRLAPSLSVVLGGRVTQLTASQIAGQAPISPVALRPVRRRKKRK